MTATRTNTDVVFQRYMSQDEKEFFDKALLAYIPVVEPSMGTDGVERAARLAVAAVKVRQRVLLETSFSR